MTKIEIFENLMLPLKVKLGDESWNFLLSRGQKFIEQVANDNSSNDDDEQPNPIDYPETPEGDQQWRDDYWQGDIAAEIYHDDMGDR